MPGLRYALGEVLEHPVQVASLLDHCESPLSVGLGRGRVRRCGWARLRTRRAALEGRPERLDATAGRVSPASAPARARGRRRRPAVGRPAARPFDRGALGVALGERGLDRLRRCGRPLAVHSVTSGTSSGPWRPVPELGAGGAALLGRALGAGRAPVGLGHGGGADAVREAGRRAAVVMHVAAARRGRRGRRRTRRRAARPGSRTPARGGRPRRGPGAASRRGPGGRCPAWACSSMRSARARASSLRLTPPSSISMAMPDLHLDGGEMDLGLRRRVAGGVVEELGRARG